MSHPAGISCVRVCSNGCRFGRQQMAPDQQTREADETAPRQSGPATSGVVMVVEARLRKQKLEERQEIESEKREKIGPRQIPQAAFQVHQHAAGEAHAHANGGVPGQAGRSVAELRERRDQHRGERENRSVWCWPGRMVILHPRIVGFHHEPWLHGRHASRSFPILGETRKETHAVRSPNRGSVLVFQAAGCG